MPAFSMTCHAAIRANQRGITHQMIADLLAYADVEAPVGGGCTVLRCESAWKIDPHLGEIGVEK